MALEHRLRAAQRYDAARFIPFRVDGVTLGSVRRDLAAHLRAYRDVLCVRDDGVELIANPSTYSARTEAMRVVARSLAARGLLSQWRNEDYEIMAGGTEGACFAMERAAVRFFGLPARAVHVNGLVRDGAGLRMWIATRSADKAIDPGMHDNLVGGGIARGLSIEQTLVKEAWEEAGIDAALALQSRAAATLSVCREVDDGLHIETLHAYDLMLPSAFAPRNQDGEVSSFRILPLASLARELDGDARYTLDAACVAIDCLARHLAGFAARLSSQD